MTQVKIACGTISLEKFAEVRQCLSLLNYSTNLSSAKNKSDEPDQQEQNASSFVSVKLNENCVDFINHSEHLKALLLKELESFPLKVWKNPVSGTTFTSLHNYLKIMQIGQGAYGDVWLAEDIQNNRLVALKKLRFGEEREGFSKTGIREISLLRSLQHPNIVAFYGVCTSRFIGSESKPSAKPNENFVANFDHLHQLSKGSVWMVFEYLPFDLNGTIEKHKEKEDHFTIPEVKRILYDILSALQFCHSHNIIHRDLKSANLLLSSEGRVKLADFGLARYFDARTVPLTNRVITFWYRPPELLLGADWYTPSVDIWSTGCIFAELILNKSLFGADREASVLKIIGDTLGKPSDIEWPERRYLPLWDVPEANPFLNASVHQPSITYCPNPSKSLPSSNTLLIVAVPQHSVWSRLHEKIGSLGVDLLKAMLRYNPTSRISASDALKHPWLQKGELIESIDLKRFSQTYCHAYALRKERERHKQKIGHGTLDKPVLKRTRMLCNVDFIRRSQRQTDSPALLTPSDHTFTNKTDTILSHKNFSPHHKRQKTLLTKKEFMNHQVTSPEETVPLVYCKATESTDDSKSRNASQCNNHISLQTHNTKEIEPTRSTRTNDTAPIECIRSQHAPLLPTCDTVKNLGHQVHAAPLSSNSGVSLTSDNRIKRDADVPSHKSYEGTTSQNMVLQPCSLSFVPPLHPETIKTKNDSTQNLLIESSNQPYKEVMACVPKQCTPLDDDLEETMDIEPEEEKTNIRTPEPPSSLSKPGTPPPPPPPPPPVLNAPCHSLSTYDKRFMHNKKEEAGLTSQGKEEPRSDSIEKGESQECSISPGQIVGDVSSKPSCRKDNNFNGVSESFGCSSFSTSRYYDAPVLSYPSCESSGHAESTSHETLPYVLKDDLCIRKGYTYKKKIISSCTESSHHSISKEVQKPYYKNRPAFETFNGNTASGYYEERKHHGDSAYDTIKKNRYTAGDYASYFHAHDSYGPRSTTTKPAYFRSHHSPTYSAKEGYWERRQSYESFSYSSYASLSPSPNDHAYSQRFAQQRSPSGNAPFHPTLYHPKQEHDYYTVPHYDVQKKRLPYQVKKY